MKPVQPMPTPPWTKDVVQILNITTIMPALNIFANNDLKRRVAGGDEPTAVDAGDATEALRANEVGRAGGRPIHAGKASDEQYCVCPFGA